MYEYYPLILTISIILFFSAIFLLAYFLIRDNKEAVGFDRNMKDGEIVRRLLVYAKPYTLQFVAVFFILIFSIAYDVLSPLLIGKAEELVVEDFEMSQLLVLVAVYGLILVISQICTYAQAILLQKTGQRILSAVREDVYSHIAGFSHNQFNHTPVGTLVTRVCNDTEAISRMFTNILVTLAKNVFVLVGVIGAMFAINPALALLIMCYMPFILLFTVVFRKFTRATFRQVKNGTTDVNTFLSENLSGMKVTQIFNCEDKKQEQFRSKNNFLAGAKYRQIFVFSIFRPIIYMLYISSILVLFYVCGKGYIDGLSLGGTAITGSVLVSFYMYVSKFFNPIQNLAEQFNWLQSAFASAEKIFAILDTEPEIVDEEDAITLDHFRGEIEFRHVWFAYEKEDWVLKDVSFHIAPKETVAFVGSTGSGKTTILSLLCRNYDIQKGQILVDGIDIRHIQLSCLRSHFGQMLQDVFLFAGSIRSNIVLRDESFTDEEIRAACHYVNADHFIDQLPDGLDEEVRERGNNFSAGQRQLLSFARTIIHKPDVMILDEATANIDTETEKLIQDSLEKMMNIGTMLMVAHRLSTIQHADRIIVISHGRILEQGNHFELLQKKGAYYDLYRMQYSAQEPGISAGNN